MVPFFFVKRFSGVVMSSGTNENILINFSNNACFFIKKLILIKRHRYACKTLYIDRLLFITGDEIAMKQCLTNNITRL
jgi:hypothetical protein